MPGQAVLPDARGPSAEAGVTAKAPSNPAVTAATRKFLTSNTPYRS